MSAEPILLVEDDPDIQANLEILLGLEGFSLTRAENGQVGLGYLRSGKPASVILLDLMMPVMSGYEFLAEFRREKKFADIPVILLSAAADVEKVAKENAVEYVRKPIDIRRLVDLLSAHLRTA